MIHKHANLELDVEIFHCTRFAETETNTCRRFSTPIRPMNTMSQIPERAIEITSFTQSAGKVKYITVITHENGRITPQTIGRTNHT